jgi:hypothetical protein
MATMSRAGLLAACAAGAALVAGCGGKSSGDTTPGAAGGDGTPVSTSGGGDDVMIPPETIDAVIRSLERKRRIVSHCLAIAVDSKELPKNSAGKITLAIVISPSGKAETVHVVRATLESQSLAECVIARVKEIQFPEMPKPFETSYTYGFEAM